MVQKSGLGVSLCFSTNEHDSGGTFDSRQNWIKLNFKKIEQKAKWYQQQGYSVTVIEVMRIVLAHELGHVFDERKTNQTMINYKEDEQVWVNMMNNDKKGVRTSYEMYRKKHYHGEEKAWNYAPQFLPTNYHKELFEKIKKSALLSYQRAYLSEYRLKQIVRLYLQKCSVLSDVYVDKIYMYTKGRYQTHLEVDDEQKEVYHVYVSTVLEQKPKELSLNKVDFLFYEMFYILAKKRYQTYDIDETMKDLLLNLKKRSFEECIERLEQGFSLQQKQYDNTFIHMEKHFKYNEQVYVTFKYYKLAQMLEEQRDLDEVIREKWHKRNKKIVS